MKQLSACAAASDRAASIALLDCGGLIQTKKFGIRAAVAFSSSCQPAIRCCFVQVRASAASRDSSESDDEEESEDLKWNPADADAERFREDLEKSVDKNEMSFSGIDLAGLIRKKYGRSYDVQLIKKEFLGKQYLAMNVMWKYREQRSFPLSEEEYLLHLDDVANALKCWGAVSVIRSSLEKTKERPRIGKAVSLFIDMDESGGRANEWINR
ncbi:uncharacterized protein LOC9633196 [Selaginella moellendorffii]|nr:uncharacterized protein LOC9633196 [Selaginella moellendorffii]|eukprot:XP_002970932.2 uncharacterized protein LOC9633196 [Selaginella moellendorffii]